MRRAVSIHPAFLRGFSIVVGVLSLALHPEVVRAQTWSVLELAMEANVGGQGSHAAIAIEREMVRRGMSIVRTADLSAEVSRLLSEERRPLESIDVAQLRSAVEQLEEDVALRRREAALEQAQRIRELSEGAVATLMQHADVGRRLFDACLAETWLYLQLRDPTAARTSLHGCRDQFPDVRLGVYEAAPEVLRLLAEVDRERAARPVRALSIEGPPAGCEILVSGRSVATTPEPARLPPGEHIVEIVCPNVSHRRMHRVRIGGGDRTVQIEPGFDAAVRTSETEVRLVYSDMRTLQARALRDAIRVGRVANVGVLVTVRRQPGNPSGWLAECIDVESGRMIASTRFEVLYDAPAEEIVEALTRGNFAIEEEGSDEVREVSDGGSSEREDGPAIAGAVTFGVGAASLAAGWALLGAREALYAERSAIEPTLFRFHELSLEIQRLELSAHVLGGAGAFAMMVGLPLWLPEEEGVPVWSWTLGAVGIVTVGAGVVMATFDGEHAVAMCGAELCLTTRDTWALSALLMETGAVLVALPIVHWIRDALGSRASVQASVSANGMWIEVGGVW